MLLAQFFLSQKVLHKQVSMTVQSQYDNKAMFPGDISSDRLLLLYFRHPLVTDAFHSVCSANRQLDARHHVVLLSASFLLLTHSLLAPHILHGPKAETACLCEPGARIHCQTHVLIVGIKYASRRDCETTSCCIASSQPSSSPAATCSVLLTW